MLTHLTRRNTNKGRFWQTAFDSKIEDFFRLARKPTDVYFYRLIGGFRRPGEKKANLAKMGFESRPKDIIASAIYFLTTDGHR